MWVNEKSVFQRHENTLCLKVICLRYKFDLEWDSRQNSKISFVAEDLFYLYEFEHKLMWSYLCMNCYGVHLKTKK